MKRLNDFNRIAWVYDSLASAIFFGNIFKAQAHFLPLVPAGSKVLILGGGSGRILRALFQTNPDVKVWYVEASSVMLRLSRKRASDNDCITFIHGTEADIPLNITFDVVIAPFFLDLFNEPDLSGLVKRLLSVCSSNSLWLVTDFVDRNKWHKPFLHVMYAFFNVMCGVTPEKLPRWDKHLEYNGLQLKREKSFYAGFISTNIYEVITHTRTLIM